MRLLALSLIAAFAFAPAASAGGIGEVDKRGNLFKPKSQIADQRRIADQKRLHELVDKKALHEVRGR